MKITLDLYSHIIKIPAQWGEMDAANHINNLIYLRWAESARIDYFAKIGMNISFQKSIGAILAWQECKYIFPMTFPDTAVLGTRTIEVLEDRFIMECSVFSEKHQRLAAVSKQSIVAYDYTTLKKASLPAEWLEGIEAIRGEKE